MLSPTTADLLKYRWVTIRQKHVVSALPKSHRVLHEMYSSLKYEFDFERVKNSVLIRFTTLKELKHNRIYLPRVIWWSGVLHKNGLQSGYTGLPICFNPENLKKRYNKVGCKKIPTKRDHFYVYDNLYGERDETCVLDNGNLINIEDFKQKNNQGELIEDHAVISIKNDKDADEDAYHCGDKIAQSLSYHDWSSFSIHPDNLFRSARIDGGDTREFFQNMRTMSTIDFLAYLKRISGNIAMSVRDGYKQIYWHPAEYFTVDARFIANAFNSLLYFTKRGDTDNNTPNVTASIPVYQGSAYNHNDQAFAHSPSEKEMMNCALLVWQLSLEKLRNFADVREEGYFVLDSQAEKVPVGSFLTSNIVSSALATGSLFMRKLMTGSGICKFSRELLMQKEYVPRRNLEVPVRDDFDTDVLFVPRCSSEKGAV